MSKTSCWRWKPASLIGRAAERSRSYWLEQFGLTHVRHLSAARISGGERRRCEIARVLAARPSFILLDEPFARLDPIAIAQTADLMTLLKRDGAGVLITDHNARDTLSVVDRAYRIDSGRIFAEGTPAEVMQDEKVQRLYPD